MALQRCEVMAGVGRSYFDIPTGQSQLFSENSSQLLAKSHGSSPVPQYLSPHLFQKVTPVLVAVTWFCVDCAF